MKKIFFLIWGLVVLLCAEQDYNLGTQAYSKGEYLQALQYFEKSCKSKNVQACFNLGVMYEYGEGVKKDRSKAIVFYTQACDGGEGAGCGSLGVMYEYGMGVSKDIKKAKEFYQKACDLGNEEGCRYLK